MYIGYARTSTIDQEAGFEAQLRDLTAAGCTKVFKEQVSSVAERTELTALLAFVREGDVVIVTALDRLARSMTDLLSILDTVKAKGASLRILAMGLDSATSTGELMVMVLGAVAQFERKRMLERQREGIAAAKASGKYKGRQPTAMRKSQQVRTLAKQRMRPSRIARELGISRSSVWRILKAADEVPGADQASAAA